MPLRSPNLDDRTWKDLMDESIARIRATSPEWTDFNAGDPGITLLDVFAYLTDTLIYRVNQVPDKLYIEFLRLIGVRLFPPSAATTQLVFRRVRGSQGAFEIPRGTRVTVARPTPGVEPPTFSTAETVALAPDADEVRVTAFHAELVEAEDAGRATGNAGLRITVGRPPIIAPTGDPLDLVVGVEAQPGELGEGDPGIEHDGRTYRVWREVENFTYLGPDRYVYLVDRFEGSILFGPEARMAAEAAAELTAEAGSRPALGDPSSGLSEERLRLAAVPGVGREIRIWYRRGGSAEGNVAANTLTTMKEPIRGLEVTNPEPATGGRNGETLENALVRGPQELHTLSRAVTARDFQIVAERASGAVARARAVTQAELWRYATPGTVEVFLVPALPDGIGPSGVSAEQLVGLQTADTLERVQAVLDERRPLGTTCLVDWVRYKTVRVKAQLVVHREEDRSEVRRRVDERLHATVNPLPTDQNAGGWPFGQSLYASSVYKIILSEPGVRYARGIQLIVDSVPNEAVRTLAADPFQPRTWFAGAGPVLFRSLNEGDGWEAMIGFDTETVVRVRPHPERPGLVAAATHLPDKGSRVYFSHDSGATWQPADPVAFRVEDLGWIDRRGQPLLLMATDVGLYELAVGPQADPLRQILVDPADQDMGFYAVAASREIGGVVSVAVAARETRGIFLSTEGGEFKTFGPIGLQGKDIRSLAIQDDGGNQFLWAGVAAAGGDDPGEGAHSWQLLGKEKPVEGWRAWRNGWQGGSCWALAFRGRMVLAASHQAGVLWLDTAQPNATWQAPTVGSGLPLRDLRRFHPVDTLATDPAGRVVMAGGIKGVRRSRDGGASYDDPSRNVFEEEVTLPPTWLLVNGANEIDVTTAEDAAE